MRRGEPVKPLRLFLQSNNYLAVVFIGLAVAVFGLVGTGRYSLDALIAGRRAARG